MNGQLKKLESMLWLRDGFPVAVDMHEFDALESDEPRGDFILQRRRQIDHLTISGSPPTWSTANSGIVPFSSAFLIH